MNLEDGLLGLLELRLFIISFNNFQVCLILLLASSILDSGHNITV